MCVSVFMELCFCWVFLRCFLPLGFSSVFFLVGVGQHLPKSCHCLCPQLCIVCVVFCIGSNYDLLVWRAQSALHHIGRGMCTAHKLWLVAC